MKYTVIGREIRKFKDKDASADQGRDVFSEFCILYCVNDPSARDSDVVEGQQVQSFSFFPGNGLLKIAKDLPIPCIILGDTSRYKNYVNLTDIEVLDR